MKKHFKAVELKYLDDATIMKIREWRNQPFVKSMMYSQREITEEEHRNYIAALKQDDNRGLFVFYLDNEPFGVYQYTLYDEGYVENGNYLIKEKYQESGYGVILLYFQMEIIFNVFKCAKSYGEVLAYNVKTVSLNKKLGGHLESIEPKGRVMNGVNYDVYRFALNSKDWEVVKKKYEKIIYMYVDKFELEKDIIC